MINVVLADDHQIVREGLKRLLDETPDIKVVDEASTGREALQKIKKNKQNNGKQTIELLR